MNKDHSINLKNLYESNHQSLMDVRESFSNLDLQGPLLMSLDKYWKQPLKLFIIGQETNGCDGDYRNIDSLLKPYRVFNMGEKYPSSPFWNITRKIERIMQIDSYSCAWSNLNRYDYKRGAPLPHIIKKLVEVDFLLRLEIDLIKPDVCIFYTNRKYDYRLKNIYDGLLFENIEGLKFNHFCRLNHPDLPYHTYRTPHPKSIRIRKLEENFISIMSSILPKAIG